MLYLVTAEWIENPRATAEEAATVWKQMIDPSVKELAGWQEKRPLWEEFLQVKERDALL